MGQQAASARVGTKGPRGTMGGVTTGNKGTRPGVSENMPVSKQRSKKGGTRPITVGTKGPR